MTDRLFSHSLHGHVQNMQRLAVDEVNRLDRQLFSDPALGGKLKQITERFSFDVARIDKDAISAKARQEDYQSRDYGRNFTAKRSLLDVTIPYSGNPDSFKLQPSHSAVIMNPINIGRHWLTLTVPDDQSAQGVVDTVVGQLTQNLDTIRKELEQSKPHLEQTIQKAADARKAQIANDDERDKNRTFKVQR